MAQLQKHWMWNTASLPQQKLFSPMSVLLATPLLVALVDTRHMFTLVSLIGPPTSNHFPTARPLIHQGLSFQVNTKLFLLKSPPPPLRETNCIFQLKIKALVQQAILEIWPLMHAIQTQALMQDSY